eukprot:15179545-Alexandrium_andersonii.AAC.1
MGEKGRERTHDPACLRACLIACLLACFACLLNRVCACLEPLCAIAGARGHPWAYVSPSHSWEYPGSDAVPNACLLYTSDAADDM